MKSEWKLIAVGFGIAGIGSVSAMLYIVGLSALYIGRFAVGAAALIAACVAAFLFRRYLGSYLDTLDARADGPGDDHPTHTNPKE